MVCLPDTLDICAGAVVLALDTFCRSRDLREQFVIGQWPATHIAAACSKQPAASSKYAVWNGLVKFGRC